MYSCSRRLRAVGSRWRSEDWRVTLALEDGRLETNELAAVLQESLAVVGEVVFFLGRRWGE